jgi:hypothetical protein
MAVQFLEGTAIELVGRDVAGDGKERDRIEKGVAETDRQVGRARAAGGEGRRRLAGDTIIDVGHEAGDALVVDGDRGNLVGALVEGVDEADVAVPAEPEDVGHFLADEIVDDDLATVEDVGSGRHVHAGRS